MIKKFKLYEADRSELDPDTLYHEHKGHPVTNSIKPSFKEIFETMFKKMGIDIEIYTVYRTKKEF